MSHKLFSIQRGVSKCHASSTRRDKLERTMCKIINSAEFAALDYLEWRTVDGNGMVVSKYRIKPA